MSSTSWSHRTGVATLKDLKIRGQLIRSDSNGLISLTDIWGAAGFTVNQKPGQWQRLDSSQKLMMALMERIVGKSHNSGKIAVKSIYYSKGSAGTFAHPVLACAYAGYLSPKLEVEVREVWLRYRAGDATLADEILEKASPEANEWAGVRALSRTTRNKHTAILQDHGVNAPIDFANITNETYIALFDKRAKSMKAERGLKKNDNLRDKMGLSDLTYVMAAESLANERIEQTNPQGPTPCQIAVRRSARHIREAIEKDRADRG
jgi:KilA domain-containing protein